MFTDDAKMDADIAVDDEDDDCGGGGDGGF